MGKENISIEKLKKEHPSFFKTFPLRLIEFALSENTAQTIANICIENKLTKENEIEKIAFHITHVLFGKIKKEDLSSVIEKELNLRKDIAEKISKTTEEIIFSPLLKELKKSTENEKKEKDSFPKKRPLSFKKDAYREPIN